jgi:hypothetical protein
MEAHYVADELCILLSHVRIVRMYFDGENFDLDIFKYFHVFRGLRL